MPIGICRLCIIYHPPMVAKLRRTERSSTSPVQPALHNGTRVENIHPTSLSFTDYSTSLEVTPIPGCTIWMNEDRDSSWLIFNLNHDDLTVLPLEREDRKTEGRYYRYWMKFPRCHFVPISMPKSKADVHAELLDAECD